jgi:serine O-acetyltransferase
MTQGNPGGSWRGTVAAIKADFGRVVQECSFGAPVSRLRYIGHIIVPASYLAIIFRLSHLAHAKGYRRLAAVLCLLNQRLTGVVVHPASRIGHGLYIPHPTSVTLCCRAGNNLSAYPGGYIVPEVFPGWMMDLQPNWPRVGDNLKMGSYAAVIGDVTIGDGVLLGVQTVVQCDLPDRIAVFVRTNSRATRDTVEADRVSVEQDNLL